MKSLCTSIPNNERKKAVREVYDNHLTKTVSTKVILKFFNLLLTLNKFDFNSVNCLQTLGCAMGTICAPAYANIFMAQFEKQNMYIQYYTYDISMIYSWYGQKVSRSKHKIIESEHSIWHSNISFLDTLAYKGKNSTFQTTLYRKPTDQQYYLHSHSDKKQYRIVKRWGSKPSFPH